MHYIVHYGIWPIPSNIIRLLEINNIPYTIRRDAKTGEAKAINFDVDESDPSAQEIQANLPECTPSNGIQQKGNASDQIVTTQFFPKYTEQERSDAKWLRIRGTTTKIDPANTEDVSRATCVYGQSRWGVEVGHHKVQAKPIEIKRMFKWGNSQFFSESITTEGLFCDDRAVSIMEHAGLQGLQYGPVLKWRTSVPIPNVHQILPKYVIPNGAFASVRDMEPYTCEMCGMQMLRISGQKYLYAVRDSYLDPNVDFYQTLPIFIDYSSKYSGGKVHYIISQRTYRVLKENKMCRGVEFTPLTLF